MQGATDWTLLAFHLGDVDPETTAFHSCVAQLAKLEGKIPVCDVRGARSDSVIRVHLIPHKS